MPATYVPIVGSDMMFPVRRIYCIGRNYAAHSREMGSDPQHSHGLPNLSVKLV